VWSDVLAQRTESLSHELRVDTVLDVDVDAVEPVLLYERVHTVREVRRCCRVADLHLSALAADREDDLLAALMEGLHVGLQIRVGVSTECVGQTRVDGEADLPRCRR